MKKEPKSQIQLFIALGALVEKMNVYKKTKEVILKSHEVALMQELYPDVQVLSSGSMAVNLNISCASCILDAFKIFISLYDRLARDPNVNAEATKLIAKDNEQDEETFVDTRSEADIELDQRLDERIEALKALGFVFNEELSLIEREDKSIRIDVGTLRTEPQESYEANLSNFKSMFEIKDDTSTKEDKEPNPETQAPAPTAPETPVAPPVDNRSPQQKAADNRKINAAKKKAEIQAAKQK